ncbi:MAG: nodulation protein NfeD [Nitrososphaerales archaeon]
MRRSLALCIIPLAWLILGHASAQPPNLPVVSLEGSITTMSVELVKEALSSASASATPVILTINTPGGNLDATFEIIEAIERAEVPVIGYVYPSGSTAWSAGTYILLSTHIAAMAPHTLLGSAQPVSVQPLGGAEPIDDTKVLNALTAFMVEKARMHGRNETAARLFVLENLNLSAEEASRDGVIDILASSMPELLEMLDGTVVDTAQGPYSFRTLDAKTVKWSPSLRIFALQVLSEPMVSYLLFIIGIYALIFGVTSPGYGGEVLGAIFIILGIIGLGFTEANIGALILIGIGAVLLVAELFAPGFGLLGGGGFFCMVLGGILLIPPGPWVVSLEWLNRLLITILVVPAIAGAFFIFAAYKIIQARRRRPFIRGVVGGFAEAADELSSEKTGFVVYKSEYWRAKSSVPIKRGAKVKVVRKDGSLLYVEPVEEG